MIPAEDWLAVSLSLSNRTAPRIPRRFKWKFKDFKKAMRGVKLKRCMTHEDYVTTASMEDVHGGLYWPTTDGGLVALPYDSKKFVFSEWVEA